MSLPPPTQRLAFRRWTEGDAAFACLLWGDGQVTRFISRGGFSDDAIAARLRFEMDHDTLYGLQYWPISETATGQLVGCCELHHRATGVLELGFHLRPEFWGRGRATEAARAAIACAFAIDGCTAIFAGHHPENTGSKRTLEKLGFRWTHEELFAPTGLQHPCYLLER